MARVLTAEDDPALRQLIEVVLTRAGHDVVACPDADAALAEARKQPPDVILTDVDMPPGMSGLDLVAALKADPLTSAIPIVLVTGSVDPDLSSGSLPGVADLVPKPFFPRDLVTRVHRVLTGQLH